MKKVLLVVMILVLLVASTTFAACSSINQINMASMGWLDYENYTYDVYENADNDNSTLVGTMTYTFKRVDGDVEVNGKSYNVSNGALITVDLLIFNGQYNGSTLKSVVVINSTFSPTVSYKSYVCSDNSLSYTTLIDYSTSGKNGVYYYTDANGTTSQKEFKKSAKYDNDSLYTLIRASVFDTKNYGLSMYVCDKNNCEQRSVTVSKFNGETKVTAYNEQEFTCTKIATSMKSSGSTGTLGVALTSTVHYLYFADAPVKVDGKDVVKPLVKIEEGNYSYVLKNISISE